ncbi:MAG TPA: ribose 5-phosphate isomerase B [bacterium]|nr:ribose 5-phosphate isomerase B [bacterium]
MFVAIASDHGGFPLKKHLAAFLEKEGHMVIDRGCNDETSVDYPDYAALVAQDILAGNAEFGILVCGTGIGMSIMANRHPGVRAALVHRDEYAKLSREHNDANVICLGGRFTTPADAERFVKIFLSTAFEGGRHQRRVEKLDAC